MTAEDRPTLIYYVQTVLNTFKRSEEQGFNSNDRQYAIELLSKAMEYQNDIWNDAIEACIKILDSNENYDRAACTMVEEIKGLKK